MKTRLLALVLALAGVVNSMAAPPLGAFIYDFSSTNNPLWDLSGPLEFHQQIIGAVGSGIPLDVPISVDQNIKGRIEGSGFATLMVDTNPITAKYHAEGKVFTASTKTKVKLNVRATGRDVLAGVTNTFKIVLVYQLEIDPLTRKLGGTVRGQAKFSKLVGGRVQEETTVALPAGNDGRWTLKLNLNSATPPGGNAEITLPNGRFLQYSARGSHSVSKDQTRFTLRGFGNGAGSKVSVLLFSTNAIITDLRGSIFGQKLNAPARPTPTGHGG